MPKENNKLYKTLIIITFLIACFFLAKWVNDVRPRYEIKERIIELRCARPSGCLHPKMQGEVIGSYCVDDWDNWYDRICYIKEKVRVK